MLNYVRSGVISPVYGFSLTLKNLVYHSTKGPICYKYVTDTWYQPLKNPVFTGF